MALGNYGVIERYYIDITNSTNVTKKISYTLRTGSHAFVIYGTGDGTWGKKIKIGEEQGVYESYDEYLNRISKEIFSINIAAQETKTLMIGIVLPEQQLLRMTLTLFHSP